MCIIEGMVVVRGQRARDDKLLVKFFNFANGNVVKEIPCPCEHRLECIMIPHPADGSSALEICADCRNIKCYSTGSEEVKVIFKGTRLDPVCPGPGLDLLALDPDDRIMTMYWKSKEGRFSRGWALSTRIICRKPRRMCYNEKQDILFITGSRQIQAVKLGELMTLWQVCSVTGSTGWTWLIRSQHIAERRLLY